MIAVDGDSTMAPTFAGFDCSRRTFLQKSGTVPYFILRHSLWRGFPLYLMAFKFMTRGLYFIIRPNDSYWMAWTHGEGPKFLFKGALLHYQWHPYVNTGLELTIDWHWFIIEGSWFIVQGAEFTWMFLDSTFQGTDALWRALIDLMNGFNSEFRGIYLWSRAFIYFWRHSFIIEGLGLINKGLCRTHTHPPKTHRIQIFRIPSASGFDAPCWHAFSSGFGAFELQKCDFPSVLWYIYI